MSGRYFRGPIGWEEYRAVLDLRPPPGIEPPEPRWNIPPMSLAPVIHPAEFGGPGLEMPLMLWSLVPGWWNRPLSEKKWSSFNAQCETITDAPAFRGAFRYRRCLVPASGWFVWTGPESRRTPMAMGLRETPWFCFAGIWDRYACDGSELDTFAILTTSANGLVAAHSLRMPVVLRPEDYESWLDPAARLPAHVFDPFDAAAMEEWPADPAIGNVRNQGPELVKRRYAPG